MSKIVVVGAGYAGLHAALRLAKTAAVTVVSRDVYFNERIRLHESAAGHAPLPRTVASFLESTGVALRLATVQKVRADELLLADGSTLTYDFLVLAPGSRVDQDAVPGAREHADAFERDRLPTRLADAERVCVVGSGLSGIEGACEIAESHPNLKVTVLTQGQLRDAYSPRGARHVLSVFERLGIALAEMEVVREIQKDGIITDRGRIGSDVCIWAGGFVAPPLARDSGLPVNERGQVLTDAALRVNERIYAVGDAAAVYAHAGSPIYMSCKTASFLGQHVAQNLTARLAGRKETPFSYRDYGVCVSLGRHDGVIQLRRADGSASFAITGKVAAWIKEQVCQYTLDALERLRAKAPPARLLEATAR